MSQSRSRPFLSIGEVVDMLTKEFADVSVSKVRFLETEGLIEPERTPSGYRKFTPGDVARLRYILRLQRDQFMPLKVIRQRLEHFDPGDAGGAEASTLQTVMVVDDEPPPASGLQLSFDDLVASSGLDAENIRELEEYGLVDSHPFEGGVYYDEDDLMVAKVAKDFSKFGIHPRHMRMYRNFADREAGLFEQIFLPLTRSDNGRRQLTQSMNELVKLSKRLKHIVLRSALRQHLQG